jgi:putative membrane protein
MCITKNERRENMIRAEWEYIKKSKLMKIVLAVIIFIPSIYAVTFLKSMWDPYGELKNLPVAVVNQDKAVNYQGKKLAVGQNLTDKLDKSSAMDFQVMSSVKDAKEKLSSGKVFMVITIPKNFSKNATTLMNSDPKKMTLHYETSAGHNYVASKMTSQAAETAAASVSEQVTKTYAKTLFASIKQLSNGMSTASNGSKKLEDGTTKLVNANDSMTTGLNKLASSSLTFNNGAKTLSNGLNTYLTGVSSAKNGSQNLSTGLNQLNSKTSSLSNGVNQLAGGSSSLSAGIQQYTNGVSTINSAANNLSSGANQFSSATANLANNAQQISDQMNQIASQPTNNDQNSTADKVSAVADQQGLTAEQKAAILAALGTSSNNNSQIQALAQSVNQLSSGLNELNTQSAQLASGADQISNGSSQLIAQNSTLNSGANSLNNGLNSLNQQIPTFSNGISQLTSGAGQLTSGLSQLTANSASLSSGTTQLASGAAQISNGASQLQSGSDQMGDGLIQVGDGQSQLTNSLASGADKSAVDPTNKTYDQMSTPTTTKHVERDHALNNGTAMAPYMISVSVFIGALAFNMLFDLYTPRKYPETGFGWWASKASIKLAFAIGDSFLVYILLAVIDGFSPVHPFATMSMIILTSTTMMAIVSWLNLIVGKIGSFLSMILLVLQLSSSAGTYPIELSNGFFQAIHPWLPMSYSVSGLRDTLMTGNTAWPEALILLTFTLAFMLLTLLFYTRRRSRLNKIDFTKKVTQHSRV